MKPNRQKVSDVSDQEPGHPDRMLDLERHEQPRRREDDQTQHDRLGGGGADVADDDFQIGDRRRQHLVDRAVVLRHVDAERGVGDALRQHREHDQPGHDEGAVADAVDLRHARADRGAEHDEVQRGRDHRRQDALHQGAEPAGQLEGVDRADRVAVHRLVLTRLTKMSSSELSLVCRSLKSMPWSRIWRSRLAMPVVSPWVSNV